MQQRRGEIRSEPVNQRLRQQSGIFLAIFAITLILTLFHLVADRVNPLWAVLGAGIGVLLGAMIGRSANLGWDGETGEVVKMSSTIGTVMLVLYVLLMALKSRILGRWIDDAEIIAVIGLAMTAAAMFTRVAVTRRGIVAVIRAPLAQD